MANAVAAQLLISGTFTSKTAFIDEAITTQLGPDPSSGTQPCEIECTWDNSDLSMDPSNVLSPLFGLIGRYTPMRVQVSGSTVLAGEAETWAPDRTIGHTVSPARGRSWTAFTAKGVLARLQLWKEPLRSPIYQNTISINGLLGYWPLEGSGTNLPNAVPNGFTGKYTGSVTRGGDPGPGGSDVVVQLGSDGALSGSFLRDSGSGWQVCFAAKLPNILGATSLSIFKWRTSSGLIYDWQVTSSAYKIVVTRESDGTVLVANNSTFGGGNSPLNWVRMRVRCTVSGGTVTVEPAWYQQDLGFITGYTETFSGTTTGNLTNWNVDPTTYTNGAAYGHVLATSDTTVNLSGDPGILAAFNGYLGELAAFRWSRLLTQVGISALSNGDWSTTMAMGRQKPGLLFDLLEECVITDGGVQYESVGTAGAVTFRTRTSRFGQTSKMDLTYSTNVAPPLAKRITPSGVANQITVSNTDGASFTVIKATGSLSILAPPAGIGRVLGEVDVNQAADDLLDDRAAFELNLATLDRPRYDSVTVDLAAHPELVSAALALKPGDLITLAGVEPSPVRLHAMQLAHAIGHTTWTFTMKCVPGELWDTGTYGGTARYGVKASTTNATMTNTSTSLAVLLADPLDVWSTTATGYQVVVLGEEMTVTGAFSAPVAGVQTATVTRSVNGVVRTHAAGELIGMYQPTHYAF